MSRRSAVALCANSDLDPGAGSSTDDVRSSAGEGNSHNSAFRGELLSAKLGRFPSRRRVSSQSQRMDSLRSSGDDDSSRSSERGPGVRAHAALFPPGVTVAGLAPEDEDDLKKSWKLFSFDKHSRESMSSWFLKIPLLLVVGLAMLFDFILYLIVRQCVVLYEQLYVWTGKPARLRRRLRASTTYADWKRNAKTLDNYLGNSKWKDGAGHPGVAEFDRDLIERTVRSLRRLRIHHTKHSDEDSARRLMDTLLQTGVKPNVGGVENTLLYSHTYWGTKPVVEEYVREVVFALQHITESHDIPVDKKRDFFKKAAREYGRSALCLSGGAGFGYYHLGVLKALADVNMDEVFSDNTIPLHPPPSQSHHHTRLPSDTATTTTTNSDSEGETYRHAGSQSNGGSQHTSLVFPATTARGTVSLIPSVITGTSAGALIAAMVAVRTDEELRRDILTTDLARNLTACEEDWITKAKRFWTQGSIFDSDLWIDKTRAVTFGDLTFLEAYKKTGRVLNISVIPEEPNAPAKVLNYVSAPDVVIWSAVIASAAVPGVLRPVELVRKDASGRLRPFRGSGRRWRDGSLRVDIPGDVLHRLFNVNYTVVSQVNPHVAMWFYNRRGAPGRPTAHRQGMGWRGGFFLSTVEQWLKLDIIKYLQLIRDMALLPRVVGHDPAFVFLQNFEGSTTIVPRVTISDYINILTDPDEHRLAHYFRGGERRTWPQLHMLANRLGIEVAIAEGRRRCIEQMRWEKERQTSPNPSAGLSAPVGEKDVEVSTGEETEEE